MAHLIWRSLGAVAVCGGFYLLTNRLMGPIVWLPLAVLIGVTFSRILIDLTAELSGWFRLLALEPLGGIHYKFQTFRVHVVEDDDHCRWIATEEVLKIAGQLASDQALAKLFPSGHQYVGKNKKGYLRDDALITHLANATTPQAIKFKNWAERNVAFPARKIRQRKGIAIPPAAAERDD